MGARAGVRAVWAGLRRARCPQPGGGLDSVRQQGAAAAAAASAAPGAAAQPLLRLLSPCHAPLPRAPVLCRATRLPATATRPPPPPSPATPRPTPPLHAPTPLGPHLCPAPQPLNPNPSATSQPLGHIPTPHPHPNPRPAALLRTPTSSACGSALHPNLLDRRRSAQYTPR
jgi:hypothetical protein